MADTPPPSPPQQPPPSVGAPPPPPSGASHSEWRAWRHQARAYERAQYGAGGWYGPWPWHSGIGWGFVWPAGLVLIGVYYLLSNLGLLKWLHGDVFWPSVLIVLGVVLLLRRGRW